MAVTVSVVAVRIVLLVILELEFFGGDLLSQGRVQIGNESLLHGVEHLVLLFLGLVLVNLGFVVEVDPDLNLDENFLGFGLVEESHTTNVFRSFPAFTDQFVDEVVPHVVDLFSGRTLQLVEEVSTLLILRIFPLRFDPLTEEHETIDWGFDKSFSKEHLDFDDFILRNLQELRDILVVCFGDEMGEDY